MTDTGTAPRRIYHGWWVVVSAFLVAQFGWGLGFYGSGIYLVALQERHGWSTGAIAAAITVHYVLGAAMIVQLGAAFERWGLRTVILGGIVAMVAGVAVLPSASALWHVHAGFALMAAGWAATSGAAVNALIAPWFDARRGIAVSLALNGASFGGVIVAPVMVAAIQAMGFDAGVRAVAIVMGALLAPVVLLVVRRPRADERDRRDGRAAAAPPPPWRIGAVVRSRAFLTISIPFALGLIAQVGLIIHQVAFLTPRIGIAAAGWAVSLTTIAAVAGRVGTGFLIDRVDRRAAASVNFLVQVAGVACLALGDGPAMLYLGCVLFGAGVGNVITFPGLIVQREFPAGHFTRVVALVVAVNQFTFAFAPGLFGLVRDLTDGYGAVLALCAALQALAAALVLVRPSSARAG